MTIPRVIFELGSGNDLHGGDYTKAALRAVQDAFNEWKLETGMSMTHLSRVLAMSTG